MLWMGIWLHPYTLAHDMVLGCFWKIAAYTVTLVQVGVDVTLVQVGVDFKKIYVGTGPNDVVRSWLRLQTPVDCIPHQYHMYTKCFSTLISCGWGYESTLTL